MLLKPNSLHRTRGDSSHEIFDGIVELDESYFGGVRKGKRGRGAAGKVAVFGILKRVGKVYTKVVSDTKSETLITLHYLREAKITLTGLRIFGIRPNVF